MSLPGALALFAQVISSILLQVRVRLSWLRVIGSSASKTSRLREHTTHSGIGLIGSSLFWQFGGPPKMLDLAAMMLQKARRIAHLFAKNPWPWQQLVRSRPNKKATCE